MDNLGAADYVGLNNMAQFCAEIVIVFFAIKLAKTLGFAKLYMIAFALTAARLLLIGLTASPALLIVINLFGGAGYSICMMMFTLFALCAPPELRATAQTMNVIVAATLSRFFGSIIGGALSDMFGIPAVFLAAGLFDVLLLAGLIIWLRKTKSLRDPVLL